jgi:hypothetical protein
MAKNVLATDLVVKQIEAESGLRLRLTLELSLQVPDLFGRFEAHRWRKVPPRELSIDLVADERFGRAIGRIGAS